MFSTKSKSKIKIQKYLETNGYSKDPLLNNTQRLHSLFIRINNHDFKNIALSINYKKQTA